MINATIIVMKTQTTTRNIHENDLEGLLVSGAELKERTKRNTL